jgi:hypothetical protein
MISALPLLATVNGSPAGKAGVFRLRLPMALACFAAAVALATVAAASTPLLSWMDQPGDGAIGLRDGSLRTSNVANTARWRVGDRIMLIGGVQSAGL